MRTFRVYKTTRIHILIKPKLIYDLPFSDSTVWPHPLAPDAARSQKRCYVACRPLIISHHIVVVIVVVLLFVHHLIVRVHLYAVHPAGMELGRTMARRGQSPFGRVVRHNCLAIVRATADNGLAITGLHQVRAKIKSKRRRRAQIESSVHIVNVFVGLCAAIWVRLGWAVQRGWGLEQT